MTMCDSKILSMFAALGLPGDKCYAAQVEEALRMFPYCQTKVRLAEIQHYILLFIHTFIFTLAHCGSMCC